MLSDNELTHSGTLTIDGLLEFRDFDKLENYKLDEMTAGNTTKIWRFQITESEELPAELYESFRNVSDCYLFLNPEDTNYVSVKLKLDSWILALPNLSFSCILSVEDADGQRNFFKSISFSCNEATESVPEQNPPIVTLPECIPVHFDRFVKKSTILDESSLYLTRDKLKLNCSIVCHYCIPWNYPYTVSWALQKKYITWSPGDDYELNLKSSLYPKLREEADYFKKTADSEMMEKASGLMKIRHDINAFADMLYFVEHGTVTHIDSDDRTAKVMKLADMYHLPGLYEACQENLGKYIKHDAHELHKIILECLRKILLDPAFRHTSETASLQKTLSVTGTMITYFEKCMAS